MKLQQIKKKFFFVSLVVLIAFFNSCNKKDIPVLLPPTAMTLTAINLEQTKATLSGIVNPNEGSATVTFEYGKTSAYGQIVAATQVTVTGNSTTQVKATISDLSPKTTYHYRVVAASENGTTKGDDLTFTTQSLPLPASSSIAISNLAPTSATLVGTVNPNGQSTNIIFEYGLTTNYGKTITASQSPVIGNANTIVNANISGLIEKMTYHYRIVATSAAGSVQSNDMTFTTLPVIDIDGNYYNTVIIGTQTWLTENLKVTHYRNGDPIPNVSDNVTWSSLTTPAYSWKDNDVANKGTYGALYNWHAAFDSRSVCPSGWHVPSDVEWTTLSTYLGGDNTSGGKLKETQLAHWSSPNSFATNESGFTALPSGYRYGVNGTFGGVGLTAHYWTYTQNDVNTSFYRYLVYNFATTTRSTALKNNGFSIRCLKDVLVGQGN